MREALLLKIALGTSFIGLFLLYGISEALQMETVEISGLQTSELGKRVKIEGVVSSVRQVGESQIITITEPSTVEVFLGSPVAIQRGESVEIIGTLEEYQGKKEILASKVRIIGNFE